MIKNLLRNIRYDWPMHFVLLLTNWLPDNVLLMRVRGALASFFLGSCGKNLRMGRNITFYDSSSIRIGNNVYIAFGGWFAAGGVIQIDDEAIFGPYVVLAAGNHTRSNGSFRYGGSERLDITIGRGSWVGAHSTILGGASIGKGSLVASGATVTRGNYPDDSFLAGVPAVIKKNKITDSEN